MQVDFKFDVDEKIKTREGQIGVVLDCLYKKHGGAHQPHIYYKVQLDAYRDAKIFNEYEIRKIGRKIRHVIVKVGILTVKYNKMKLVER